jgi:protein-disulfide isomerase
MYKDQPNWMARLQAVPPQQMQALEGVPPEQQFIERAKMAGFQQWAAMRGVPTAKSTECLANQQEVSRLVQMTSDANSQYQVPGTPAFLINDKLVQGSTWAELEPLIQKALGG